VFVGAVSLAWMPNFYRYIKYALFYSAPLILYSLSGVILSQFDRILINKYQGNTSAGLYSFAYNIALLQGVFVGAVSLAWMPNFYRYMADGLFEKIEKESGNIIRLYCLASLFLVYFGKEIGLILARPNFHDSLYLVPIIVSGCLFSSLFSFYGWTIAFYKKNIYLSMVVLFCGTISIFLNVLLIPKFGSVIAAVDSMISYAVMLIIAWLVSSKLLKLYSISIVNMLKIVAVYIVFTVIYYGLIWCHFPILLEIMFKLLLISVFVLFLFKNYINRFLKKQ
ncbi:MAG: oligosaccharide flippase family protein, partial [bacterium]